ncbi:alpha-tocopherol transfer protein-like isoform X3 [Bradysia coprophila]|uniref:alpha-tocopherol transfer protein-like isoform X3 n=1 Tax=Bradysia coprophila TaxID=38358 RepID=UPI00187DAB3C|nr:alpha-tocopherol transfer protein-like isoform X3 [Bradysia coprophila]
MELSERVQKVAKKELREDKFARDQCIQQMRDWLSKNEDVVDVRIDDVFLLRFLRTKKFSVPMAQQLLLKYLNVKKTIPRMTTELDCLSSPLKEVFENGYLFVSPLKDQQGRSVIISRAAKFDPHIWNSSIQAGVHFLAFETLLDDPENQVMGFVHVWDWHAVSASHLTMWSPADFEIFKHIEQSFPARHKAFHVINVQSTVKWALDVGRRLVSSKISDRITLYSSWSEYNKKCDASCLPKELGGTIPMAEMIQWWMQKMAAKRDIVVQLDKMKLLSDRGITKKNEKDMSPLHAEIRAHMDSVAGSFRKLDVD